MDATIQSSRPLVCHAKCQPTAAATCGHWGTDWGLYRALITKAWSPFACVLRSILVDTSICGYYPSGHSNGLLLKRCRERSWRWYTKDEPWLAASNLGCQAEDWSLIKYSSFCSSRLQVNKRTFFVKGCDRGGILTVLTRERNTSFSTYSSQRDRLDRMSDFPCLTPYDNPTACPWAWSSSNSP